MRTDESQLKRMLVAKGLDRKVVDALDETGIKKMAGLLGIDRSSIPVKRNEPLIQAGKKQPDKLYVNVDGFKYTDSNGKVCASRNVVIPVEVLDDVIADLLKAKGLIEGK